MKLSELLFGEAGEQAINCTYGYWNSWSQLIRKTDSNSINCTYGYWNYRDNWPPDAAEVHQLHLRVLKPTGIAPDGTNTAIHQLHLRVLKPSLPFCKGECPLPSIAPTGIETCKKLDRRSGSTDHQLHLRVLKRLVVYNFQQDVTTINCTYGYWNSRRLSWVVFRRAAINCTYGYWNWGSFDCVVAHCSPSIAPTGIETFGRSSGSGRHDFHQLHLRVLKPLWKTGIWLSFNHHQLHLRVLKPIGGGIMVSHRRPSIAPTGIETLWGDLQRNSASSINCTYGYWNRNSCAIRERLFCPSIAPTGIETAVLQKCRFLLHSHQLHLRVLKQVNERGFITSRSGTAHQLHLRVLKQKISERERKCRHPSIAPTGIETKGHLCFGGDGLEPSIAPTGIETSKLLVEGIQVDSHQLHLRVLKRNNCTNCQCKPQTHQLHLRVLKLESTMSNSPTNPDHQLHLRVLKLTWSVDDFTPVSPSIAPTGIETRNRNELFFWSIRPPSIAPTGIETCHNVIIVVFERAINCTYGYWNLSFLWIVPTVRRPINCTYGYWNFITLSVRVRLGAPLIAPTGIETSTSARNHCDLQ